MRKRSNKLRPIVPARKLNLCDSVLWAYFDTKPMKAKKPISLSEWNRLLVGFRIKCLYRLRYRTFSKMYVGEYNFVRVLIFEEMIYT